MKTKDKQYWNNILIQEDLQEWANQNPMLVKQAIENFESLLSTGSMPFLPFMAAVFCKVHNASQSAENNKANYQFAIEVLNSIEENSQNI